MRSRTVNPGLLAIGAACIAGSLAGCAAEKTQGTETTSTGGAAGASFSSGGSGGTADATGGADSTGGNTSATGGEAPSGGAATTGGQQNDTGGRAPIGGATPTGGSAGTTGGRAPTGGATATGGTPGATGGRAPTGGAAGTGGQQNDTGGSGGSGTGGSQGTMRILPLGDSITWATCWRALLQEKLNQSFASRFDFVGTNRSTNSCGVSGFDGDNQAWGSALITEIVAGITNARQCDPSPCPSLSTLQSAFSTTDPDVALVHFGTNDVWNGKPPADILAAYEQVIGALREVNPGVIIVLAQIIPMNVTESTCSGCTCSECPSRVQALNAEIETWAPGASTADSPVVVVDQWTGFSATADTNDGVHPNDTTGSQKMADAWYAAIESLF